MKVSAVYVTFYIVSGTLKSHSRIDLAALSLPRCHRNRLVISPGIACLAKTCNLMQEDYKLLVNDIVGSCHQGAHENPIVRDKTHPTFDRILKLVEGNHQ